MKTLIRLLVLLALPWAGFTISSHGKNLQLPVADGRADLLTPQQWEEDIDYFVKRLAIIHPDPYAHVGKDLFDQRVQDLRRKAGTESDVNMYFGMTELAKLVKDGHTWVSWGNGKIRNWLHLPPFSAFSFSDGLFITSAVKKYGSIVGKRIVKVGNTTTAEFMKRRSRIQPGETPWGELTSVSFCIEELRYLNILGPSDSLRLTLEDGAGTVSEIQIEAVPLAEYFPTIRRKIFPLKDDVNVTINGNSLKPPPLWLSRLDADGFAGDRYWFTYLPEQKALYVQINECVSKVDDPFDRFFERMFQTADAQGAKRLIIDVRNNLGGDHFERPLLLGILARPDLNQSDRLYLITSRFTFSAAQHLVNELTRYTNITCFGEPTAARPNFFGGQQGFYLPHSRIYAAVSSKLWQDAGPNNFRILTEPDFHVPLASADYRDNRDPVLERIFAHDSFKNMRPEFSKKMIQAYSQGGLEELTKVYYALKPDYAKFGFNMGNLLNGDVGGWMSDHAKNNQDVIDFLRFLRRELPQSIEVCWDLAGRLDRPADEKERESLYRQCLEINPAHRLAKMRLGLMELEKRQD